MNTTAAHVVAEGTLAFVTTIDLALGAMTKSVLQNIEHEVFPEELPELHNFLLAALLAPAHLGVPPPEAHSARRLAVKAKACSQMCVTAMHALQKTP